MKSTLTAAEADEVKELIYTVPTRVHEYFFPHRHPQRAAPFHTRMAADWYTNRPNLVQVAFRGGAKTTYGEEAIILLSLLGLVHNVPIIGSNETRSKERLEAIKHELETNKRLHATFGYNGEGVCSTWQAAKIVLPNNTCIQALGWDQSIRGIKHLEWRPDLCWIEDVENEEDAKDPETRQRIVRRLLGTIIPAVDAPGARIRVTGTIIDNESLVVRLAKLANWQSRKYPVKAVTSEGIWHSTWPERKPLQEINELEESFRALGEHATFEREYMCQAVQDDAKAFQKSYFRFQEIPRRYQATYAIYDPARTVHETSAHTGKIVASWQNNKLIIWESSGNFWMPDAIVRDLFETDEKYNPILVGIEKDGLEEFLMQPIRQEAMRRGHIIPIRALKAPKGKHSFIRGLQPFFKAGEVIFVPDIETHAVLAGQLLSFPSGRIDVPNSLAYMTTLKVGQPMLDAFDPDVHIDPVLKPSQQFPLFLGINTDGAVTAAVLVQLVRSQFRVLADFLFEGDAGSCLGDIARHAALHAGRPFRTLTPPAHFSRYDTGGLRAAATRVPLTVERGGDVARGLAEARSLLSTHPHGAPAFLAHPGATWTLRAFSGGYAQAATPSGALAGEPAPSPYAVLADALFCVIASSRAQELDEHRHYAYTESGVPYLSARR